MTWIIPTYSSKMAENQDIPRSGVIFVGGQARTLLDAKHTLKMRDKGGEQVGAPLQLIIMV